MADMKCLRHYPDDPYYRLGPVHTCLYVQVHETGDWDLFWARGKRRGFSPGAAARHSQHATTYTDSRRKYVVFFFVILNILPNSSKTTCFVISQISHMGLEGLLVVLERCSRSEQASLGNLGDDKVGCLGGMGKFWKNVEDHKSI